MESKPAKTGTKKKSQPAAAATRKRSSKKKAVAKKAPERWEVTIVRESVDESTIYVSGRSREEAEEAADQEFMDGGIFEFETIWSEYTFEVVKVDPKHEADPVHWFPDNGPVCKICLRTVVWTGIAADAPDNRSGKTIPGPWVHIQG